MGECSIDWSDLIIVLTALIGAWSTHEYLSGYVTRRSLASENYRVPGLSCGVVRVILCLAVLVGLRLVTDGQTDGHRAMAITADAYHRAVTSPDLNEARDDGVLRCQWHQLYHMQTNRTLLQTDNHTNTASLNF